MVRFHMSISNPDETLTRLVSTYLLQHYQRTRADGHFDMHWKGYAKNYSELQTVNSSIADHLRCSGEIVESKAFAVTDELAQIIPLQIEDALKDVRCLSTGRQS